MQIEQLPCLEDDHVSRFRSAGIRSCQQLLRLGQRPQRLSSLVKATGLSLEMVRSVVRRAELSQIRGIGPAALEYLLKVGVDSLVALAAQEPVALRTRLQRVTSRPPNLAVIENWIRQAQR